MFLIVGLGNPGEKYESTPHNIGFIAVDNFARDNNFPDFKLEKKFNAQISGKTLGSGKIILAKPQTFMNNSGNSVKKMADYFKANLEDLILIHDDIDIPLGNMKIAKDRGSAGHKGVLSIINSLGTTDFVRIRVGIQPDKASKPHSHFNVEKFVLEKFDAKEKTSVKEVSKKVNEAIETILEKGAKQAMSRFNN